MSGIFITFEGIEGSGKSTLLEKAAAALRRAGVDPVMTREPGGTPLGVALRKVLLDPDMVPIGSMAELMLFAADRAQHVSEVILPALRSGRVVLCDRYSDATAAYQGYGRGIPLDVIASVDEQARQGTTPDMTVLLDLPVEKGLKRARTRNDEALDASESRIDEEKAAFHRKVRDGYLTLAREEPGRFIILDAANAPDRLEALFMKEFSVRFPHAF